MDFVRKSANLEPIEDTVFAIVNLAKEDKLKNGDDAVIDATIGSLYDEENKFVALNSVFKHYDEIPHMQKAKYASSFVGNEEYRQQVFNWVKQNEILHLYHDVIATTGGTGAISLTFNNILDKNQTVIIPDIAWGSYALMASQYNLNLKTYSMFAENKFNLNSFKEVVLKTAQNQDKILVVINDPSHNPTGYSMSFEEWEEVIKFLNTVSTSTPCVILNDIAYIDYCFDLKNSRKHLQVFNQMSENLMCIIAFSTSKSLTSYGLRCGAAIFLCKNKKAVDNTKIVFEKGARSTWSNIPNAAMENFTWVTLNNKQAYLEEKQKYIDLLKIRSKVFIEEAKLYNLPLYPYKEGFFITIKMENNELRNKFHKKLMDNHIYTVCVNKGIRVAICSTPINKVKGLAKKINDLLINEG